MSSSINKSAVVVGSGIAGLTTAMLLSQNGLNVTILERSSKIGGHVSDWSCKATTECQVCHCCSISDLTSNIHESPVNLIMNCELDQVLRSSNGSMSGVKVVDNETKTTQQIPANALVLSTGFETFDPTQKLLWGYGAMPGVMTLAELDQIMLEDRLTELVDGTENTRIAFFQCIGSRDKSIEANYCSQYCCKAALRSAVKIKSEKPGWDVSVFYIDLQVAGKYASTLLDSARRVGIDLSQGVPGEINQQADGKLSVLRERDGKNIQEEFDRIILSVGMRPNSSSASLSRITGVGLDQHGFFKKRDELDPNRTSVDGVYVAGTCCGPMDIESSARSAAAAASSVIQDLSSYLKV